MVMNYKAIAALAYAIWDSENTTKLENPEDYVVYEKRARDLYYAMRYRSNDEKKTIANQIMNG